MGNVVQTMMMGLFMLLPGLVGSIPTTTTTEGVPAPLVGIITCGAGGKEAHTSRDLSLLPAGGVNVSSLASTTTSTR